MAGCSPADAGKSEEQAKSEGVRWSWETKPEPITDVAETIDTDICIVGLGSAGTIATLAAARSGARVVVLQKESSMITNGWCTALFNTKQALDSGVPAFDYGECYSKFSQLQNGKDKASVVLQTFRRSGEVGDWVFSEIEGEFTPVLRPSNYTFGYYINNDFATRYEQFRLLLTSLVDKATEAGADIRYSTPAVQLVTDESGAVSGVIGEREDGSHIQVNASAGVVLCTGDISDDQEMLECYNPMLVGITSLHGAPCNTGDGHKMGMWVDAAIDAPPHGQMVHFDPTWMPNGNAPFAGIPWLRVNINGERFQNEDMPYQNVVTNVRLQPEMTAFQICDSTWTAHAPNGDYPHDNSHSRSTADPAADWAAALERGAILQADTLEELASLMELSDEAAETFYATVARYNELGEKGYDEDFGVKSEYLAWNAIKQPPFFAIKRMPGLLSTVGGLKCNVELQALKESGEPVDGLYVAGNVIGNYYGDDYSMFPEGGSHGRAWTTGCLAVRSALGKREDPLDDLYVS